MESDNQQSDMLNGVHHNGFTKHRIPHFRVNAPHVKYTDDGFMVTDYKYQTTDVSMDHSGQYIVVPIEKRYCFKTNLTVPRMGLMLVGWGGNNGSTVTAGIIANRLGLTWRTRTGVQQANYYGSFTQSATLRLGVVHNELDNTATEVHAPVSSYMPMVDPNDLIIGGWDISRKNLAESVERAQVLEPDLQRQLVPHLTHLQPLPSIYYPDFIAANQSKRADNLISSDSKSDHLCKLRKDIREFKAKNHLDALVVVWTATTERFVDILEGVNDTADNILKSIETSHAEISPSTIFAVASILENVPFINGSPQNTFVPGVIELAEKHGVFIAGDDFKTGQTKLKSVLVDFLVGAGIKPMSITSYNHLGNNDGENLSAPKQFRSKEISKSNVVDDMVSANSILYDKKTKPDHVVVIKYIPAVGDSKRAMDEYYNEIFMGGRNTIVIHNTCEDSLLAAPLIIDLALLAELFTRITYKTENHKDFQPFHSVLSVLSYFLKAPLVPNGYPVINALFRQRQAIENIFRACIGLPPQNDMALESRC